MRLPQELIRHQLAESLSGTLPESDFAELLQRLAALEQQVDLLRSSPLLAEEPSLPPSLEEQP